MTALNQMRAFAQNHRANMAMILALAIIPLFAVVGFAIDMNRQTTHQNKVQNSLDFAIVATARHALKNPGASDDDLKQIVQGFFDAEIANAPQMNLSKLDFKRNGDLVTVSVSGDMPTKTGCFIGTMHLSPWKVLVNVAM